MQPYQRTTNKKDKIVLFCYESSIRYFCLILINWIILIKSSNRFLTYNYFIKKTHCFKNILNLTYGNNIFWKLNKINLKIIFLLQWQLKCIITLTLIIFESKPSLIIKILINDDLISLYFYFSLIRIHQIIIFPYKDVLQWAWIIFNCSMGNMLKIVEDHSNCP